MKRQASAVLILFSIVTTIVCAQSSIDEHSSAQEMLAAGIGLILQPYSCGPQRTTATIFRGAMQ
jgi:hypothetical protein